MKIIIIGFRGTGKSTLGKALARFLKRPFIDTDDLITEQAQKSIPELFLEEGEDGFRKREKKAIQSITSQDAVIACGGGAILDPQNVTALKTNSYCIWLTASTKTIEKRILKDSNRPPLTELPPDEEIRILLKTRTPLYVQLSDIQFNTDNLSINNLLEEVIEHLKQEMIN